MQDVNILLVVGKYTDLKVFGKSGRYKGLSPFTKEKTPSFFVDPKRNLFKCFSSGRGGKGAIELVMQIERCSKEEAERKILEFIDNPTKKHNDH